MAPALRYLLAAALLLGVVGAALAPAPRRLPASEWRWTMRWLAVAALVWAGVAHYLDADGVALGLLTAFLLLACVEVWLLRRPPEPAAEPAAEAPARPRRPARAPLWRR